MYEFAFSKSRHSTWRSQFSVRELLNGRIGTELQTLAAARNGRSRARFLLGSTVCHRPWLQTNGALGQGALALQVALCPTLGATAIMRPTATPRRATRRRLYS